MTLEQQTQIAEIIGALDRIADDIKMFEACYRELSLMRPLTENEKEIADNVQTILSMRLQYSVFVAMLQAGEVVFSEEAEELLSIVNQFISYVHDLDIPSHITQKKMAEEVPAETVVSLTPPEMPVSEEALLAKLICNYKN